MSSELVDIVRGWSASLESAFFRGGGVASLTIDDYHFRGFCEGLLLPQKVLFKPDVTPYGIILQARRGGVLRDSAVIGFNESDGVVDCLQIQGGRRRLRELSSVYWGAALLSSLVVAASESGCRAVRVVPARSVDGYCWNNAQRLEHLYDCVPLSLGFRFSGGKHVLDL